MHYAEEHTGLQLKALGYRARNLYTAYRSKIAGHVSDADLVNMNHVLQDREISEQITVKDQHLAELLERGDDVVGRILKQFFANEHEFPRIFLSKALPSVAEGSLMLNVRKLDPSDIEDIGALTISALKRFSKLAQSSHLAFY